MLRDLYTCSPSKPSYGHRSRTGRALRQGPALLQIRVATSSPNAPQGIREIASCPNLGILLLPVSCQLISYLTRRYALTGHRAKVGVPNFLKMLCSSAKSLPSSPESNKVGWLGSRTSATVHPAAHRSRVQSYALLPNNSSGGL